MSAATPLRRARSSPSCCSMRRPVWPRRSRPRWHRALERLRLREQQPRGLGGAVGGGGARLLAASGAAAGDVVGPSSSLILGCAASSASRDRAARRSRARRRANAGQYKLLADNSDRCHRPAGFDGIRRYVSPSAATELATGRRRWSGASRRSSFMRKTGPVRTPCARLQQGRRRPDLTYRPGPQNGGWIWVEDDAERRQNPDGGEPREMVA